MTDTTVTTESPQNQPGPSRTEDGTIKDQSTATTETTSQATTQATTDGDSFLTGKTEKAETKPEAKTEEPKDGDAPKPEGAPEKYADFKLPDGFKLDDKVLTTVSDKFKSMNLSQAQAQELVDLYAANGLEAQQAPYKLWADTQKQWLADINERFGSKADAVRTDINKAITNALPPSLQKSFKAALDLTGAGSNPDIVEGLHLMLKSLVEGGSVRPGGPSAAANKDPSAGRPSPAEAIYPHLINNR